MSDETDRLEKIDQNLATGGVERVQLPPGEWRQLRGTDVQVLIPYGSIVHLHYRIDQKKPITNTLPQTTVKEPANVQKAKA